MCDDDDEVVEGGAVPCLFKVRLAAVEELLATFGLPWVARLAAVAENTLELVWMSPADDDVMVLDVVVEFLLRVLEEAKTVCLAVVLLLSVLGRPLARGGPPPVL